MEEIEGDGGGKAGMEVAEVRGMWGWWRRCWGDNSREGEIEEEEEEEKEEGGNALFCVFTFEVNAWECGGEGYVAFLVGMNEWGMWRMGSLKR